ncbi:MAG: TetR/AcrR family transcriptional regulator [Beijerinckiaceae bacterium]|nr:TetR/AcrR family transcriptional regulator [Beijerinckiaceae bacterium]
MNYITHLENELRDRPPQRKSLRTRKRLMIAIAKVLEDQGYHSLRLSDATQEAGVAEGTIYVYFNDRPQAINEVMFDFLENFVQVHVDAPVQKFGRESPFESLNASILHWIKLCRANSGLIRCMFQMSDENPDFLAHVQRFNMGWVTSVSKRLQKYRKHSDEDIAALFVYSVGIMLDELIRRLLVYPDEGLLSQLDRVGDRDEVMANVVTSIWMKVLFPEAPLPSKRTGPLAAIIDWIQQPPNGDGSAKRARRKLPTS